jgi:hypothetical protein
MVYIYIDYDYHDYNIYLCDIDVYNKISFTDIYVIFI